MPAVNLSGAIEPEIQRARDVDNRQLPVDEPHVRDAGGRSTLSHSPDFYAVRWGGRRSIAGAHPQCVAPSDTNLFVLHVQVASH